MATANTPSEVGASSLTTEAAPVEDASLADALKLILSAGGSVQGLNGGKGGKPADPYAPIMRSFFSAYFKIWGTLPPPGYVEGAARSMNLYEFIDQERKKPAYRHTKAYKNEAAKYAALRDQLLGYY